MTVVIILPNIPQSVSFRWHERPIAPGRSSAIHLAIELVRQAIVATRILVLPSHAYQVDALANLSGEGVEFRLPVENVWTDLQIEVGTTVFLCSPKLVLAGTQRLRRFVEHHFRESADLTHMGVRSASDLYPLAISPQLYQFMNSLIASGVTLGEFNLNPLMHFRTLQHPSITSEFHRWAGRPLKVASATPELDLPKLPLAAPIESKSFFELLASVFCQ